ncbi:cation:proton antiporter [Nakamurella deserti]|uniref:cation:proton antiporter n=1 Tax=Nakamurella deserti TaxID=2164074 RepID=UPI001F0C5073|nr:cation:proton antiporter [Nakamurella deserti]
MLIDSMAPVLMVPLVVVLAPLLAALVGRVVRVPLVVFEVVLGLLIGPAVLGLAPTDGFVDDLAEVGLAMLFFLAGNEIDFRQINGRPLRRSVTGWLVAVVLMVGAGLLVAGNAAGAVYLGVALTSTALGALVPLLRDAGEMRTRFGTAVVAVGAVGEFGPLIAISVFLSGRDPGVATVVLLAFVAVTAVAIWLAGRATHRGVHRLINATLHTSGQFAVRLVVLVLALLAGLSYVLGLDMLLGAFAAGVLMRLVLRNARPADAVLVQSKLEGLGFGFLVPVFFVHTGMTFDLRALLDDGRALALLPVFVALMLVIRGGSGLLTAPRGAPRTDRLALTLLTATGLPIIIAVTAIGVERDELTASLAASMVGAGMVTVLLFPLLGLLARGRSRGEAPVQTEPATDQGT